MINKLLEHFKSVDLNYTEVNILKYFEFCLDSRTKYTINKTANHHILPKALFEEFSNFKTNEWNKVILTNDNHYIAHALLHDAVDNISTASAWYAMNNKNYLKGETLEIIGTEMYSKLFEKRNKMISERCKGTVHCKDEYGISYRISKEEFDSRDDLVGRTNKQVSVIDKETNKRIFIETDMYDRDKHHFHLTDTATVVDKNGNKFRVSINDERYLSGELVGHTKGYSNYKDTDGNTYHCRIDDERVISGELIGLAKGTKKSDEFIARQKQRRLDHPEQGNAYRILIYDDENILKFKSYGTFRKICEDNTLPLNLLRDTYINNNKIKFRDRSDFDRQCNYTRHIRNKKFINFLGWYARKVNKAVYDAESIKTN